MKKYILIFAIGIISWQVDAQSNDRDSLLAHERTLDRPLNVHGGQLRISAGYGFNYNTKRYDADGVETRLKEDGLAYARRKSFAEIKFGITEHLQLSTLIRRQNSLIRSREIYLIGFPSVDNSTQINETEKVGGFEDLYLGLDFRIPLKTRKLDLVISAGSFIPTGRSKTPQPDHSLEVTPENDWHIVYRNFNSPGDGTLVMGIGASMKYRLKTAGLTISAMHYHGLKKEVNDLDWTWQLNNGKFAYRSTGYKRGVPDRLHVTAMLELQPSAYFNVFLYGEFFRPSNGWREWEGGVTEHQNLSMITAGPGFELIITPRIWFRETITFPLLGENMDNGLQFFSTFSFNLFVKQ